MIEFHRSDMAVIDGKKCCMLTGVEGTIFYNLWKNKGSWVSVPEMMTSLNGKPVHTSDPRNNLTVHIYNIRKKLRESDIEVVIENQRQSFWLETKYRIK